jgi:hypothetical protein
LKDDRPKTFGDLRGLETPTGMSNMDVYFFRTVPGRKRSAIFGIIPRRRWFSLAETESRGNSALVVRDSPDSAAFWGVAKRRLPVWVRSRASTKSRSRSGNPEPAAREASMVNENHGFPNVQFREMR